ncbi:Swi5-domain-containing protein [Scheffersomyces coipomensis]|uniref:Swi5-domain-containing protein n=1 Tax=Scheffersomyces coipomensis TaxID=1788519 RepID=UPI00315D4FCE
MNPVIDIPVSSLPESIQLTTTTTFVQPQSSPIPPTPATPTASSSSTASISCNNTNTMATAAIPINNTPGSNNQHYTAFSSGDTNCNSNNIQALPSTQSTSDRFNNPTINNTPRTHSTNADDSNIEVVAPLPVVKPSAAEVLQQRLRLKEEKLNEIKNQCSLLISELDSNQDPVAIVKKHISQLKKYNELKDIALDLVRLIAEQRHVKTSDIFNEMEVDVKDD